MPLPKEQQKNARKGRYHFDGLSVDLNACRLREGIIFLHYYQATPIWIIYRMQCLQEMGTLPNGRQATEFPR